MDNFDFNAKLARRINDYWARRGYDARAHVEVHKVTIPGIKGADQTFRLPIIASDTVNGLPRRRLAGRAA